MRCNRRTLADFLAVSLPTITNWIDEGLPFTIQGSKGKEWEFESAEVLTWWAANKARQKDGRTTSGRQDKNDPFADPTGEITETLEEAQLRKESALADKHQLAAAREAEILVPIDEVKAIVVEENARVRARLLSIPNAVRPIALVHLNNNRKASEKLVSAVEAVIVDALTEVASYMGGVPESEDGDGDE